MKLLLDLKGTVKVCRDSFVDDIYVVHERWFHTAHVVYREGMSGIYRIKYEIRASSNSSASNADGPMQYVELPANFFPYCTKLQCADMSAIHLWHSTT